MSDEMDELRRIRMAKMQKILEAQKTAEAAEKSKNNVPTLADKIDQIILVLLTPRAQEYLKSVKERSISTYNQVREALFPPEIAFEIDELIMYLKQGMIRRGMITKDKIILIERRILGISSSITIKKRGEDAVSLGNFLNEEKE